MPIPGSDTSEAAPGGGNMKRQTPRCRWSSSTLWRCQEILHIGPQIILGMPRIHADFQMVTRTRRALCVRREPPADVLSNRHESTVVNSGKAFFRPAAKAG
jgi:hypothetical protein